MARVMINNNKTIPKLHFPEFSGGWRVTQLNSIAKIYDGTHQTPDYVGSGVPFYSVEHLTANNFNNTKLVAEKIYEQEEKRVKIERGDILMTRIGDIGTTRYIDWNVRASFYVSLALIKQSDKYVGSFLNQYIKTDVFQSELWRRTIHVAFPKKINLGEIGNCIVKLPTQDEQQKIAGFLTVVDDKITTIDRKVDLLKNYKKSVMQKIFNQQIRFKDEDGNLYPDWQNKKLGEITRIVVGGTPETSREEYWNGGIGWLSSGDINNGVVSKPSKYITALGLRKSTTSMMPKNTVLLAMTGATLGRIGILSFECSGNQSVAGFLPNDRFSSRYLFYSLYIIQNQIISKAAGAAQPGISKSSMGSLIIPCPNIEEQQKIADFLTRLDDRINLDIKELNKAKQFKKALLQRMFV